MEEECSHTSAILLAFIPDSRLKNVEKVGIWLIVHQCGCALSPISFIPEFVEWNLRGAEGALVGRVAKENYVHAAHSQLWGHMAYATDPPYCTAYPMNFFDSMNSSIMTICHSNNHPTAFEASRMVVCQLLPYNNSDPNHARLNQGRCIIIPQGMHFGRKLFPEILTPHNHAMHFAHPKTKEEIPFVTVGHFCHSNAIFPSIARDDLLYSAEQATSLQDVGVILSICLSNPSAPPPSVTLACQEASLSGVRGSTKESGQYQAGARLDNKARRVR